MAKDITLRINTRPDIIEKIKQYTIKEIPLSQLTGSFWKPQGVDLSKFHPRETVVRIRTFPDGISKAEKIVATHNGTTYTHTNELIIKGSIADCRQKLDSLNYEPWLEYSQSATEYQINYANQQFNVLEEIFNNQALTLKFEADQSDTIWEFLAEFAITPNDVLNLNTAELLAF